MESAGLTGISPVKCVKSEIHNIVTVLRLTKQFISPARFHSEITRDAESPKIRSFQQLFDSLSYVNEFHIDASHLEPFLAVIMSSETGGAATACALAAVNKFVAYNLIHPDSPSCPAAINALARGVLHCRFQASGTSADEVVLLKILGVLVDTLRCPAGAYLTDEHVWLMVRRCYQIRRQPRSTYLLRNSADNYLLQLVLTIFGHHKTRQAQTRRFADLCGGALPAGAGKPFGTESMWRTLKFLAWLTCYSSTSPALVFPPFPSSGREESGGSASVAIQNSPPPNGAAGSVTLAEMNGGSGAQGPNRSVSLTQVKSSHSATSLTSSASVPPGAGQRGQQRPDARTPERERGQGGANGGRSSPNGGTGGGGPPSADARGERESLRGGADEDDGLTVAFPLGVSGDDEEFCQEIRSLGLSLLNVALESGGEHLAGSPILVQVVQDDICKSLLQNSRTGSLFLLSVTLRCVFTLFLYFKRHLKVQLEIFFNSIQLKIAGSTQDVTQTAAGAGAKAGEWGEPGGPGAGGAAASSATAGMPQASLEQKELALESLVEFSREPELMREIYQNYDLDVRCTNLFEALVKCLVSCCKLEGGGMAGDGKAGGGDSRGSSGVNERETSVGGGPGPAFTALHRLALSGLTSILHSIASRCHMDPVVSIGTARGHGGTTAGVPVVPSTVVEGPGFLSPPPQEVRTPLDSPGPSPWEEEGGGPRRAATPSPPASEVSMSVATTVGGRKAASGESTAAVRERKEKKKRLSLAAQVFNTEPSKCLNPLQNLGFLTATPDAQSMSLFLKSTPGLDMRVIGEYLAKRKEWNGQVRSAFVNGFEFCNCGLVEGLKRLLSTFRLPGESQEIERIMETFASAYFRQQEKVEGMGPPETPPKDGPTELDLLTPRWIVIPSRDSRDRDSLKGGDGGGWEVTGSAGGASGAPGGEGQESGASPPSSRVVFHNSDTVFILSYSIIMLNTDLHNPQVKKKMSLEEFQRNNRGINGGEDLPLEFLLSVYEEIKEDPIRLDEEGTGGTGDDEGYWERIMRRLETADEFSTISPLMRAGPLEREMLQVLCDAGGLQSVRTAFESSKDFEVMKTCIGALLDFARVGVFFGFSPLLDGVVETLASYLRGGSMGIRSQVVIAPLVHCLSQYANLFRGAWGHTLDFLVQLYALGLLPPAVHELDDFTDPKGKPLHRLCRPQPPPLFFARPRGKGTHGAEEGGRGGFLSTIASLIFSAAEWSDEEDADTASPVKYASHQHPNQQLAVSPQNAANITGLIQMLNLPAPAPGTGPLPPPTTIPTTGAAEVKFAAASKSEPPTGTPPPPSQTQMQTQQPQPSSPTAANATPSGRAGGAGGAGPPPAYLELQAFVCSCRLEEILSERLRHLSTESAFALAEALVKRAHIFYLPSSSAPERDRERGSLRGEKDRDKAQRGQIARRNSEPGVGGPTSAPQAAPGAVPSGVSASSWDLPTAPPPIPLCVDEESLPAPAPPPSLAMEKSPGLAAISAPGTSVRHTDKISTPPLAPVPVPSLTHDPSGFPLPFPVLAVAPSFFLATDRASVSSSSARKGGEKPRGTAGQDRDREREWGAILPSPDMDAIASFKRLAEPVICLEFLSNLACIRDAVAGSHGSPVKKAIGSASTGAGLWEMVRSHFLRLLLYLQSVPPGMESGENFEVITAFAERVCVCCLRLCLRLGMEPELVADLLSLLSLLGTRLDARLFRLQLERVASALLTLVTRLSFVPGSLSDLVRSPTAAVTVGGGIRVSGFAVVAATLLRIAREAPVAAAEGAEQAERAAAAVQTALDCLDDLMGLVPVEASAAGAAEGDGQSGGEGGAEGARMSFGDLTVDGGGDARKQPPALSAQLQRLVEAGSGSLVIAALRTFAVHALPRSGRRGSLSQLVVEDGGEGKESDELREGGSEGTTGGGHSGIAAVRRLASLVPVFYWRDLSLWKSSLRALCFVGRWGGDRAVRTEALVLLSRALPAVPSSVLFNESAGPLAFPGELFTVLTEAVFPLLSAADTAEGHGFARASSASSAGDLLAETRPDPLSAETEAALQASAASSVSRLLLAHIDTLSAAAAPPQLQPPPPATATVQGAGRAVLTFFEAAVVRLVFILLREAESCAEHHREAYLQNVKNLTLVAATVPQSGGMGAPPSGVPPVSLDYIWDAVTTSFPHLHQELLAIVSALYPPAATDAPAPMPPPGEAAEAPAQVPPLSAHSLPAEAHPNHSTAHAEFGGGMSAPALGDTVGGAQQPMAAGEANGQVQQERGRSMEES